MIEQLLSPDGVYRWAKVGPQAPKGEADDNDYLEKRRRSDPDLWLVELDTPGVERFAAELLGQG